MSRSKKFTRCLVVPIASAGILGGAVVGVSGIASADTALAHPTASVSPAVAENAFPTGLKAPAKKAPAAVKKASAKKAAPAPAKKAPAKKAAPAVK